MVSGISGYLEVLFMKNMESVSLLHIMLWYGALLVTMTLAVISFDRFLFIVKPFAHKKYMKPYTAVIIVQCSYCMDQLCAILNTTSLYVLHSHEIVFQDVKVKMDI